jgi:hypothetical protein
MRLSSRDLNKREAGCPESSGTPAANHYFVLKSVLMYISSLRSHTILNTVSWRRKPQMKSDSGRLIKFVTIQPYNLESRSV